MGCMPLERTQNIMGQHLCVDRYNEIAMEFNGKLDVLVTKLNKELHGAKIVFSNPYFPFLYVIRRPELYGKCIPIPIPILIPGWIGFLNFGFGYRN